MTGSGDFRARLRGRPWWLGIAVAALGAVWLHGAWSLPQTATYAAIGPGLFVTIVALGLVLVGALLVVAVARRERFEPQDAEDADATREPSRRAFWLTVLGGVLPVFLVRPLGFPVVAAVTFALVARAFGSRRLAFDLALGLGLGIACWLLFSRFLGLPLPGFPPAGLR
jgi:putative tricarboxylic transport membrane protein